MEGILGRRLRRDEVVHHINGDRRDNRPENLEVMTRAAHSRHHQLGRVPGTKGKPGRRGTANPHAILTEAAVREIRAAHAAGESALRLADRFGVTRWAIYDVIRRRKWAWLADSSSASR